MVDGDQSSGAGADRTPPLGARGRSSSFPNLAQNAFVAALGVGDGAPRDAAAGAAPAGGSDVGDVAPARASAAWYLPPLGLRHLSEVRARNLVPPRGAEHSRGAGFRFTLAAGGGAGEPEAVVYTSEVATDTLNPDWEPLDDVDLERRARGVVGAAASSSDESARLDRDADEVDATGSAAADRPSAPALTLTVWHVENPASSGDPAVARVFSTRLALDDLARAGRRGRVILRLRAPPSVRLRPLRRIRRGRVRAAAARVVALPAPRVPAQHAHRQVPVARAMGRRRLGRVR